MAERTDLPWAPCPNCGENLNDADALLGQGVAASNDPEGKARIELLLTCYSCESEFFVFIAVSDLTEVAQ